MTPLVLVHGFMGGSAQWAGQVSALEHARDVIALDLPGFGKNAHLTAPDRIEAFGQWVIETLDARGINHFDLLGHSMGGMIAQHVAVTVPDKLKKLVLYGTGATGVLPGRFEPIQTSKERAKADGPQKTAHRISATWFLQYEGSSSYAACAAIAEQSSLQAMLAGLDAMQNWSGVESLSRITAETLVVWGDKDRTYPWSQTEQLWQSIADTRLAVLPNCAHAAHLEKPTVFNGILTDFLTPELVAA